MVTRNPAEVIVSNLRRPARALLDWYSCATECPFGLAPADVKRAGFPEFVAWIVGRMYDEALTQLDARCLVLDYRDISPDSVNAIGEHFGLSLCREGVAAFRNTFRFHAKRPQELFVDDTLCKRQAAGMEIMDAADRRSALQYKSLVEAALKCGAVTPNTSAMTGSTYVRKGADGR
jgi:hypothetical protein